MRKGRRRTRVHLFVLCGPEEFTGDERRKLVPPVGRTGCSRFGERRGNSPFEGNCPLGGHEGFRLRRKFGCRPGGRRTSSIRLSLIYGHQPFAESLFISPNGDRIAASGSRDFFFAGETGGCQNKFARRRLEPGEGGEAVVGGGSGRGLHFSKKDLGGGFGLVWFL